jgi:hypothetical protein
MAANAFYFAKTHQFRVEIPYKKQDSVSTLYFKLLDTIRSDLCSRIDRSSIKLPTAVQNYFPAAT